MLIRLQNSDGQELDFEAPISHAPIYLTRRGSVWAKQHDAGTKIPLYRPLMLIDISDVKPLSKAIEAPPAPVADAEEVTYD
jgi:hypothetical protein